VIQTGSLSPDHKRSDFSVQRHHDCVAAIPVLLLHGRPAGVFEGVSEIVVDAVEGKAINPSVDVVSVEATEVVLPFIADGDSSSAVSIEVGVPLSVTSILHSCPRGVKWVSSKPVNGGPAGFFLAGKAPARAGFTSIEDVSEKDLLASANALASPRGRPRLGRHSFNHGPAPERLSSEVIQIHGAYNIFVSVELQHV